jgi:hypothetical protein
MILSCDNLNQSSHALKAARLRRGLLSAVVAHQRMGFCKSATMKQSRTAEQSFNLRCANKLRGVYEGTPKIDLTGKKFGLLTVLRYDSSLHHQPRWVCQCECGVIKNLRGNHLRNGATQSCGCRSSKNRRGKDHGCWTGFEEMTGSFLSQWRHGAKARNFAMDVTPKDLWEIYIQQGRKCALSGLPLEFKPIKWFHGTASIDRIDSKKGYVKGNIQWVHRDINRMKLDYPQDYFIKICTMVAERNAI